MSQEGTPGEFPASFEIKDRERLARHVSAAISCFYLAHIIPAYMDNAPHPSKLDANAILWLGVEARLCGTSIVDAIPEDGCRIDKQSLLDMPYNEIPEPYARRQSGGELWACTVMMDARSYTHALPQADRYALEQQIRRNDLYIRGHRFFADYFESMLTTLGMEMAEYYELPLNDIRAARSLLVVQSFDLIDRHANGPGD